MARLKYNLDKIQSFRVTPGRYRAKVIKIEQTLSQKKKPMLLWHWKIVSGKEKGNEVRSFTSLQENALGQLKDHLTALGYSGVINTDTAKLIGKYAVLLIGPRMGTDRATGRDREFTGVLAVLEDTEENLAGDIFGSDEEDNGSEDDDSDDGEDTGEDSDGEEDQDTDDDSDDNDDDTATDDDDDADEVQEEPAPRRNRPVSRVQQRAASKKVVSKKSPRGKLPF